MDLLRGVAALAVLVYHAFSVSSLPAGSSTWLRGIQLVASQGYLGVPLFFVISGFCIHMAWARKRADTGAQAMNWYGFWKRRMYRLYPPYLAALLIAMAAVLGAYLLHAGSSTLEAYPQPTMRWMGIDFVLHAFMLHGLFTRFDALGGNSAFWSLAREEYLYALYAVLLLFRRKAGLTTAVTSVAVLGVISIALPLWLLHGSPSPTPVESSAFALWIQWCLGMVAVEAHLGLYRLPRIFSRLWMFPVWFALAKFSEIRGISAVVPPLYGLAFFTLLNALLRFEWNVRWGGSRLVTWLANVGLFSYSLYLIHNPVLGAFRYALARMSIRPATPALYLIAVVLAAAAGYYVSKLFYRAIEARFLNRTAEPYRREKIEEPRAVAAAAGAV